MRVTEIIEKAKDKLPMSYGFRGRLSAEEIEKIEEFCDVSAMSIYMDGSCYYQIRYLPESQRKTK